MKKRVLLIGGTGYVGGWVIQALKENDCELQVLTRSGNSFLADRFGVAAISESDLKKIAPSDVVVNLAYPTETDLHDNLRKTRAIFRNVEQAASKTRLLIHLSTQAVFGYDLTPPFPRAKIPMRFDHSYIESKILMENLILESPISCVKRIIRLGNVWGPGSAAWTVKIAKKLTFMEAVGIRGEDGFCNATDVHNIASYIAFIVGLSDSVKSGIDHLAELSSNRWSQLIEPMASELGVSIVLSDFSPPPERSDWLSPIHSILNGLSPKSLALAMLKSRQSGALLKRILEWMPSEAIKLVRKNNLGSYRPGLGIAIEDPIFLKIMAVKECFTTEILEGWIPPFDIKKSNESVKAWLRSSGFSKFK